MIFFSKFQSRKILFLSMHSVAMLRGASGLPCCQTLGCFDVTASRHRQPWATTAGTVTADRRLAGITLGFYFFFFQTRKRLFLWEAWLAFRCKIVLLTPEVPFCLWFLDYIFFSSFFKHHNGKDYSCLWRGYPYLWPTLDTAIHLVLRGLAFTASEFCFAPFSITIYFIYAMRVHFTGQQPFFPPVLFQWIAKK